MMENIIEHQLCVTVSLREIFIPIIIKQKGQKTEKIWYYDLSDIKAVNPNRKIIEDTRTPEELIALIEAKQKEIDEAIRELKG